MLGCHVRFLCFLVFRSQFSKVFLEFNFLAEALENIKIVYKMKEEHVNFKDNM